MSDDTPDTDTCDAQTASGEPCQNPATEGDYCWINSHGADADDDVENQAGRDTRLDRELQESIASMLEQGQSVRAACRVHNLPTSTFYDWIEKGAEQEAGIFSEFSERVVRARGHGEATLVNDVLEMAREQGDTRTVLSVIKSRYPESWGDADANEDDGGEVNVILNAEPAPDDSA